MQRSQPSHRPSANSLTLVPVGTTEYIAAGDSQAAVPYPSVRRDFDLQWKMLHIFPVCCYSLAVTTGKRAFRRRALRRPHPARREVPCGDTDMDWPRPGAVLHTTGPWGRSYLGVGRRAASRAWQRALSKGRHGFTVRENLPWKNTRMGLPEGNQKPYGHLAEYRGWPETRASKHKYWAWRQTAPPSLTAGGAGGLHQGSPSGELNWRRKQALVSPGEGEWRSKRDTGQFFPPLTCYPTHGKKLAQRRDCRISRRCSVSPSPQLYRCLPERRRAPTHRTRQHSVWSEPSPPWGTARLGIGTPRRWHPLSSGPTSAWRQPSLSADHRNRQGAAQSFWSSGCGPRICAMLLRDTATPRLGLPPPKAVLAGSPPDRGRAWWEPWARIQAGVSGQRESSPAQTQGTLRSPKMLGGPWPSDGSECGQERCLSRQVSATYLFP